MMSALNKRISSLDTGLFAEIPSQTSESDKRTLLLLQDCVRNSGQYTYLEIGSHLGGTIQTHFIDPVCKLIFSVDKRSQSQPDERGRSFEYDNNSTERMLKNLANAFPSVKSSKIRTFDSDASEVDPTRIKEKPKLCFIDGEHTNQAVVSDFRFCFQVSHPNAIIAFHDACFIFKGIENIKKKLSDDCIHFYGLMLEGSVYAILLNEAVNNYADKIGDYSVNESEYFRGARKKLWKQQWKHRARNSLAYSFLRKGKVVLKNLTHRST